LQVSGHVKIHREDDSGMYDAINKGFRKSRGSILCHLNSDEQYLPGALKAVADFFEQHPDVDILVTDTMVLGSDGRPIAARRSLAPCWFDENVRVRVQTCSLFYRRQIIKDENFFETSLPVAADLEFIRSLRRKGYKFARLPVFTSSFTETSQNLSMTRAALRDRKTYRSRWPWWVKPLYPLELAVYYTRAVAHGCFRPATQSYSVYTLDDPLRRTGFDKRETSFFWPARNDYPAMPRKWHFKCDAYRALSFLPKGSAIYDIIQRHVTGSTIPTDVRVRSKLSVALDYWSWLKNNNRTAQALEGVHLDIGAGWKPVIPLAFYSLGFDRQVLVDIDDVMRPDTVIRTTEIYERIAEGDAKQRGIDLQRMPHAEGLSGTTRDMLRSFGIEYIAPYNTSHIEALQGTVSLATCTQVLLHVEESVLAELFKAAHTALKPGGIFVATVHLKPLYAGLEQSINDIEHLRYSPAEWRSFGSSLMSYTRVKAPQYRALLEAAGFRLAAFDVTPGTKEDLLRLETSKVDTSFEGLTPEDLVARHLFFAAEKTSAS
jgi:SAM-dependent methyltransferase